MVYVIHTCIYLSIHGSCSVQLVPLLMGMLTQIYIIFMYIPICVVHVTSDGHPYTRIYLSAHVSWSLQPSPLVVGTLTHTYTYLHVSCFVQTVSLLVGMLTYGFEAHWHTVSGYKGLQLLQCSDRWSFHTPVRVTSFITSKGKILLGRVTKHPGLGVQLPVISFSSIKATMTFNFAIFG